MAFCPKCNDLMVMLINRQVNPCHVDIVCPRCLFEECEKHKKAIDKFLSTIDQNPDIICPEGKHYIPIECNTKCADCWKKWAYEEK